MYEKNFKEKIFITKDFKETQDLGIELAKELKGGSFVALYGDLGSGKTTFAQGLAKGLGIKKRIISPTFIIVRCYELQTQNSKLKTQNHSSKLKSLERFYHIDLYRISSDKNIKGLGLKEIINDPSNIIVVEWAEKLKKLLPKKRKDIYIEYLGEDKRRIIINN